MHLSNHTLGLISLQAQETARPWVMALWHSPFSQILLYGSLSVHAFCGLVALARRRHHRMPAWDATQMLLGLFIPYLLLILNCQPSTSAMPTVAHRRIDVSLNDQA